MPYTVKYGNMQVTALTPEFHEQTCNYWYTVTCGATAHTAFTTKAGLVRWLAERGLKLDGELPEARGEFATMRVIGEYYSSSHAKYAPTEAEPYRMIEGDDWHAIKPLVITAVMSNARYTLALITEEAGVRTVHHLNPNVKTRIEVASHPGYAIMRGLMS